MRLAHQNKTSQGPVAQAAVIDSVRDVRVLNAALALALLGLFVGYLALTTRSATRGYSIKGLEQKISLLEDQKRKADVESTSLRSMAAVSVQAEQLGLVPVATVDYVEATGGAVAVR